MNQNQGHGVKNRDATRYDSYSNNHGFLPLSRACNDRKKCTIVAPIFVDHEDPLIDSYTEVNSCHRSPFHVLKSLKLAFGYRI